MVAAWISALSGFAASAHEEQQGRDGEGAEHAPTFGRPRGIAGGLEEFGEIECVEGPEEQKHAEHEAEVADAVDDESFLAGVGSGFSEEIEADQKVAGQANAFPTYEEQHIVRGEDQNQHEEHEQIQVGEEAVVAAFMGHVTGRVDVNEEADAGDDEDHDHGELVHLQVEAGAKISGACASRDPVEEWLFEGLAGLREVDEEFTDGFDGAEERDSG
jgi:hypothetical protein